MEDVPTGEQEVEDDPRHKALIQEYLERRAKVRDCADDHWKLALWCEQNGLKQQATAHFYAGLAARSLAAMRRGSTWDSRNSAGTGTSPSGWRPPRPKPKQQKANKQWKPLVAEMAGRHWPAGTKPRRRNREGAGRDRRSPAVPMIWAVFGAAAVSRSRRRPCRLLGQIDVPGSSRALADDRASSSGSADVQARAVPALRAPRPAGVTPRS